MWRFIYFFSLALLAFFSFSFVDPNLVISSHPVFWQFQTFMWGLLEHRELLTFGYVLLVLLAWVGYWRETKSYFLGKSGKSQLRSVDQDAWYAPLQRFLLQRPLLRKVVIGVLPLLIVSFGYNALSHDVFNYMFNVRMVIDFGANPHVETALAFSDHPWVRFMHNTHTPAPYGYGWTALSLLPAFVGNGIFIVSWLLFRFWAIFALALFIYGASLWWRSDGSELSDQLLKAVFWNPLVVLEIGLNMHNDFWMLSLALFAFLLLKQRPSTFKTILSGIALLFSISTKLATLVLVPIWIVAAQLSIVTNMLKKVQLPESLFAQLKKVIVTQFWQYVPLVSSVLLFLPLLTERSKRFLPWYLLWSWCWLALSKRKVAQWWLFLLVATFAALLRYVPWLYTGGFDGSVENQQLLIVWGGSLVGFLVLRNRIIGQHA